MRKKIIYLAAVNPGTDLGVTKKILATTHALIAAGFDAKAEFGPEDGYRGVLTLKNRLRLLESDLVILRSCGYYMPILLLSLIALRMRGTRIVIDTPTPLVNFASEIWGQRRSWVGALSRLALLISTLPWSHWVAHRVVQYGFEHPWFLVGLRKKTVIMGNGVRVADHTAIFSTPPNSETPLVLIGVAKLAFWHGYDRVIRGLAEFEGDTRLKGTAVSGVQFVIVGEGLELMPLRALARDLGVEHRVSFVGRHSGVALKRLYHDAHIAISSLGLHRLGLRVASPLKTREYLSLGLPVAFSYDDPDVHNNLSFIFKATADETPISIGQLITWYEQLTRAEAVPHLPRAFAEGNLDFSRKISLYTDMLEVDPR